METSGAFQVHDDVLRWPSRTSRHPLKHSCLPPCIGRQVCDGYLCALHPVRPAKPARVEAIEVWVFELVCQVIQITCQAPWDQDEPTATQRSPCT
eukprot:4200079-Alexandrium_andersonii.AAC.1